MESWEYQVHTGASGSPTKLAAKLNDLGRQGWEVAGTFAIKKGITADEVGVALKRPAST